MDRAAPLFSQKLYRPAELAERLKCSVDSLARMRKSGKGPAFLRIGNRFVYAEGDVEAWLQSLRARSSVGAGGAPPPSPPSRSTVFPLGPLNPRLGGSRLKREQIHRSERNS